MIWTEWQEAVRRVQSVVQTEVDVRGMRYMLWRTMALQQPILWRSTGRLCECHGIWRRHDLDRQVWLEKGQARGDQQGS